MECAAQLPGTEPNTTYGVGVLSNHSHVPMLEPWTLLHWVGALQRLWIVLTHFSVPAPPVPWLLQLLGTRIPSFLPSTLWWSVTGCMFSGKSPEIRLSWEPRSYNIEVQGFFFFFEVSKSYLYLRGNVFWFRFLNCVVLGCIGGHSKHHH